MNLKFKRKDESHSEFQIEENIFLRTEDEIFEYWNNLTDQLMKIEKYISEKQIFNQTLFANYKTLKTENFKINEENNFLRAKEKSFADMKTLLGERDKEIVQLKETLQTLQQKIDLSNKKIENQNSNNNNNNNNNKTILNDYQKSDSIFSPLVNDSPFSTSIFNWGKKEDHGEDRGEEKITNASPFVCLFI